MGRRSPYYLTRNNAAKHRGNKDTSAVTDNTSQDIFYTTESIDTQARYDYTNKYKQYKDYFTSDIYDSGLFDTPSTKRIGSGESYTFDDYTTSGISYNIHKKRPQRQNVSVSTSDHIYKYPENYNNISAFRDYNHFYPKGSRGKKQLRLIKDFDQSNYQDILDESEENEDRGRKYRSPRSRYYQDLIHEEPEKEYAYGKYFEKANTKVRSLPKKRRLEIYADEKRNEKHNGLRTPNKQKDYQVYAYQDPKHHEEVFKGKNQPGDISLSSEVEIKTHEYPVLAFRDPKSGNQDSGMVYLPIIVLDKKSGKREPEKSSKDPNYQSKKENFQIYAANLQEQNIFQNFGDFPNTITSQEPTKGERDYTPQQDFGIETTSGMKYAGSLLDTIIDEAVETDFGNEDFMTGQKIPYSTGKYPFTYQVDVDISPSEPTGSLKDKGKKSSHPKNSTVNDLLHDGYPVTKDYIKVSVSEQNRNSSLHPLTSKEENKPNSVMGQVISNAIRKEDQTPSSIRLIDDNTISMSIAQSKSSPPTKSIMRNPSQEQLIVKEFSSTRQSVAKGTTQSSRASHIGPAEKAETKGKPTGTKLSVVNEESTQDLHSKYTKTGTPQKQSVIGNSNVASSGSAENMVGAETSLNLHGSKSMKPDTDNEQTADRQSKVQSTSWTPPSPVSAHKMSVLHSPPGQNKQSTEAPLADTPSPSSHNIRTSHAQSRKSAVEGRIQTTPWSTYSPVSDHKKSTLHSLTSQNQTSIVAHVSDTKSPVSQDMRSSNAQSRKSAVSPRPFTANVFNDDGQKSKKASTSERSHKAVPASLGKKSLVQSLSHHNTHVVAGNTGKLSNKGKKDGDSEEALRQFTKDVFEIDLRSQEKPPSHTSEQKKRSVSKDQHSVSGVSQNHGGESKHEFRRSITGQQPINALGQFQNELGNVEPPHRHIGDNSAGIHKVSADQEGKRKPGSLMRTTSKMFTSLSKIGKNKSTEHAEKHISTNSPSELRKFEEKTKTATQNNKDSHFVRSIEPTVTQYKKEQNTTHPLAKSKSKPDTKAPKEKKSLTRLFSRSKSKLSHESGDETKKKNKSKRRNMSGILKRSKSSELSVVLPAEDEEHAGEDKQTVECECLAHYVQNTRTCAYFFLGTTLHEQIMNIVKIFLGGN